MQATEAASSTPEGGTADTGSLADGGDDAAQDAVAAEDGGLEAAAE